MPLPDRIHILGASGSGTTSLAIAVAARNIATVIWTPTTSSGCEPIQTHAGKRVVFEFEDVFAGRRQSLRSDLYLFPFVGCTKKTWASVPMEAQQARAAKIRSSAGASSKLSSSRVGG